MIVSSPWRLLSLYRIILTTWLLFFPSVISNTLSPFFSSFFGSASVWKHGYLTELFAMSSLFPSLHWISCVQVTFQCWKDTSIFLCVFTVFSIRFPVSIHNVTSLLWRICPEGPGTSRVPSWRILPMSLPSSHQVSSPQNFRPLHPSGVHCISKPSQYLRSVRRTQCNHMKPSPCPEAKGHISWQSHGIWSHCRG